jgi:hypothetical protein
MLLEKVYDLAVEAFWQTCALILFKANGISSKIEKM